jgi:ATP-dependent protease HslVU (ClpYQ) peptidase subunit
MTCIAAYKDFNGNIFVGGDSIGINESDNIISLKNPKVFIKDKMIFGFTGPLRMGQILQYDFDIPKHPNSMDDYTYLISIFIDSLITKFEEKKYATITDNAITASSTFIIGYNKQIYKVEDNFQVIEINKDYQCAGCGEEFGLGAFWALDKMSIIPEDRIYLVLKCAAEFSLVKEPFLIFKLSYDSGRNI